MQVVLRDFGSTDAPFIYATWTKSEYYSNHRTITIPKQAWFASKISMIKLALELNHTYVACLLDDPDFIVGYRVGNDKTYIKQAYRNQGVEALLESIK